MDKQIDINRQKKISISHYLSNEKTVQGKTNNNLNITNINSTEK